MDKKTLKSAGLALLLALCPIMGKAAELMNTPNLTLNLDASFEQLGELQYTSNHDNSPNYYTGATETLAGPHRDDVGIYLFQNEDALELSGVFDKVSFYFEEDLGGSSVSTSNNEMNLYQMYADVPVYPGFSVVVGQFKVPSDLSSAQDWRSLMFTETSPLFSNFFNQGYDNGVGIKGKGDGWDATFGTISGCPDLPQRYLPEIFSFPPMLYTRFGVGNISDDAYQQVQDIKGLKEGQWGLHFNGEYIDDADAGHSDDLALQNTDATTVSSDTVFGNALLWSNWNPFLGKTAEALGPMQANYWNASVDSEYRGYLGKDKTFIASAQWSFAEFNNEDMALSGATLDLTRATINLQGGELMAGLDEGQWGLAGRFDIVLPSNYLIYNSAITSEGGANGKANTITGLQDNSITGDKPLVELTFPSITYRIGKYAKLTAEGMYWLNSPEAAGNDGVYELMEMPSQVTDIFPGNPMYHNPFVAVARMGFTLAI